MKIKEKLQFIKYLLLAEEIYNPEFLYFAYLYEVHDKYKKNIEHLGWYKWRWRDCVTYQKNKLVLLRRIEDNKYIDLETNKIYKTIKFIENDFTMEKGNYYIDDFTLTPYKEKFISKYPNTISKEESLNNLGRLRENVKTKKRRKSQK